MPAIRASNGSQVPHRTPATGVAFAQKNNIALFPFPVQGFPASSSRSPARSAARAEFSATRRRRRPTFRSRTRSRLADNLSITRGNHTFKTGVDIRRYRFDNIYGGGTLIFGSIFSSSSDSAGSGAPLADFLMGYPSNTDGKQLLDWARQRDLYAGSYFQDDWKISSSLTINVGIRYDLYTQPVDARDRGGLFDVATGPWLIPGKNGFSRAIVTGDHNNWAPRLGFAYSASPQVDHPLAAPASSSRGASRTRASRRSAPTFPTRRRVLFPAVSAGATITPPVTISSPLAARPRPIPPSRASRRQPGKLQHTHAGLQQRARPLLRAMELQRAVRAAEKPAARSRLLRR